MCEGRWFERLKVEEADERFKEKRYGAQARDGNGRRKREEKWAGAGRESEDRWAHLGG